MISIFNLSLQINGFPIKGAVADFEKIQAIPEDDFENYIYEKGQYLNAFPLEI